MISSSCFAADFEPRRTRSSCSITTQQHVVLVRAMAELRPTAVPCIAEWRHAAARRLARRPAVYFCGRSWRSRLIPALTRAPPNRHSGGVSNMMKEGSQHLSGLEEAVLRNIEACKEVRLCTSAGPRSADDLSAAAGDIICCCPLLLLPGELRLIARSTTVRADGAHGDGAERHEQDGDQPPGQAVRDQRRGHDHPRAGGAAPGGEAHCDVEPAAGGGGGRRHGHGG